ncbi:hypothetical protein J3D55_002320 [Chryseobacterium ginsenosidimutans]|nr:hypothetical protein [Chryseobacterium ginsenosidimutans]
MDANDVNFNNLPKMVSYLISEMVELKLLLNNQTDPAVPVKITTGKKQKNSLL